MTPTGAPDGHACIRAWQTLRAAHDRVARQLGAALARECALAVNEFDVLLHLHARAGEEVRLSALLGAVPLSQPALSRLVARLAARGLVARSDAESDGRGTAVCLTPAGADLLDRAVAVHGHAVHAALTGHLTDEEQAALLATLSRVGRRPAPV